MKQNPVGFNHDAMANSLMSGFFQGLLEFAVRFWWLILLVMVVSFFKLKSEQAAARVKAEARKRRIEEDERIRERVREERREKRAARRTGTGPG